MQGDLFASAGLAASAEPELVLLAPQLRAWQQRLHQHQAPLFRRECLASQQGDLFAANHPAATDAAAIDPLALTPLPLNFWRWPTSPHVGAAIYLVLDRPADLEQPLLLYVGETMAADRRWKGEHDCKAYLAAYGEALQRCGLPHQLSIRFCTDVPRSTKARRALEQRLIQRWLPPFNKETRQRWATPFTADP
ncbi:MAG: GIY-YIG nuclease family protein [Cyanobacteria bacterium]|nr:GIY-YIG nuclease family protein [Cyanobacteriota bacterium]